jgi:hypothetical protein
MTEPFTRGSLHTPQATRGWERPIAPSPASEDDRGMGGIAEDALSTLVMLGANQPCQNAYVITSSTIGTWAWKKGGAKRAR